MWRLSGSIGAEILGIDLAAELDHNVVAEIRRIWQAVLKSLAMPVTRKIQFCIVCRDD